MKKIKISNWLSMTSIETRGGNAAIEPERITRAHICSFGKEDETLVVSLDLPLARGSTTYWIKKGPESQKIIDLIKHRVHVSITS